LSFPMSQPELIAIVIPVSTYMIPTFQPNRLIRRITATSLIIGAAIKKEKVTPKGTPSWTKPKNSGIAEQEQKGVNIPSNEARIFPVNKDLPSNSFCVFSVVKEVLIIPTKKTINTNRRITLGTSKIKKRIASESCVLDSKPNNWLTILSARP